MTPQPPLHYAAVVFPGFQLLDLAGPLDVLNLLSIQPTNPNLPASSLSIKLLAESLDPVPVKPRTLVDMNPSFSQSLSPTETFSAFLSSNALIDVLLIPGGIGTREPPGAIDATVAFVKAVAPRVKVAMISVCTGSDVLASSGLLNHRTATTNHLRFSYVSSRHADKDIKWLSRVRWVKSPSTSSSEPEMWTSAGISAGIDVTLAFVAEKYGKETATKIARAMEYEWKDLKCGETDTMYAGWPGGES